MESFRNLLDKILEVVCSTLMGVMTILATWQVASRYVLNKPSTFTEEALLISFVWAGLLGATYVFGKQDHMRMSFIVDKFSPEKRAKVEVFTEVLILLFAALVLVFGGFKISKLAMGQLSPSMQIPMGYIYFVLPLSGMLTMVYNVMNIHRLAKSLVVENLKLKTAQ
jgi:TRAP-type C4-dicarboxylate transport system permease small subunit